MCGIAIVLMHNSPSEEKVVLGGMIRALKHRGPDDEGILLLPTSANGWQVGLGHTRLSILDLSSAGHQPMQDPETGNWIVFNGEIYNFQEVRHDLESRGYTFRTQTDTEVILKAYAAYSVECLPLLRGMFAFAIWNAREQSLFLARDRMGVKPLYYCHTRDAFLFASEVRALLASGCVPRQLSMAGLDSYLALGAVQDPLTIIENVYAFPAGHYGLWQNGTLTTQVYWQPPLQVDDAKTHWPRQKIVEELRNILEELVRLRLISDVPLGVFVSGGIDSSAIVSLMCRASSVPPCSVSVVFPEHKYSETVYMRQVVQQFSTQHREVMLTEGDMLASLPDALTAMDQPTFDGVNTYIVSKHARQAGLKVALSGIGGDELFGGYANSFITARRLQALVQWTPGLVGRAVGAALNLVLGDNDRGRKLERWFARRDLPRGAYFLVRELFPGADRHRLMPALDALNPSCEIIAQADDVFNNISMLELTHYLKNVLLRDTDFMSMAVGLEVREPLLDHRLVEFVLSLPGLLKSIGVHPKSLLVEAIGDLPVAVQHRPKHGFVLPFAQWLRGPLRAEVEAVMLEPMHNSPLGIATAEVQRVWERYLAGRGNWVRPWALYVLHRWLMQNLEGPARTE